MSKSDDFDQRVVEDIVEYGFSNVSVFPRDDGDDTSTIPFSYSVGIWLTQDHPEVLIMGLPAETAHSVMWSAYKLIEAGTHLEPNTYVNEILLDHRVAVLEIDDIRNEEFPLGMVYHLEGSENPKAVQLVWPDKNHRFPWHDDFSESLQGAQVLLGTWVEPTEGTPNE